MATQTAPETAEVKSTEIVPAEGADLAGHATTTDVDKHLASEDIVVSAPFSFAGSAARVWRPLTRRAQATENGWASAGCYTLAGLAISFAWLGVAGWYVIFGLLVVPYRLIRRSQRKRKLEGARHRELLEAVDQQKPEAKDDQTPAG